MGKPYGALAVVKTRIIRLEKPYYTSGKAISYVWNMAWCQRYSLELSKDSFLDL